MKRSIYWIVAVGWLAAGMGQAQTATPTPILLRANLAQTFAQTACPSNAPAGSLCLDVTAKGIVAGLGPVELRRLVRVKGAAFNPAQPTCVEGYTRGTLSVSKTDTLTFEGLGQVCLSTGIAGYHLVVTGGTGRYAGVVGGGAVTVPPPDSGSTGRELWDVLLYPAAGR
ncbi:hypothetical protein [Deinococcus aquaedulcis]|uniref:hypothetical protein n=1 Tax=Deinococcus aquaedulcis TaxID=2840455 RepID=UPI001C84078C|nr:hypothetical protein [Deinococcus aquaedulcis]